MKAALIDPLLCAAFFLSGASALAFETLWFHQAGLAFGNAVWTSSLVLSGFMAGVAFGNRLAARIGDRLQDPVRAFAGLELLVAGSGIALTWLLPSASRWLAPLSAVLLAHAGVLNAIRFAIAFGLLLLPALAMGMTLPLLTRALSPQRGFGPALSLLYFANTLGAVVGTLATESVSLALLGVRGTSVAAGVLDLTAAGLALWTTRRSPVGSAPPLAKAPSPSARMACLRLSCAAFLSGLALLALEVVWLRVSMLFLNDTPLAFSLLLATVLAGIALGSLAATLWMKRSATAANHVPLVAYAAGLCGMFAYRFYPRILQRYFQADQSADVILALVVPLVLSTAIASGALFVLTGDRLREAVSSDAAAAGRLAFANTLGAALGPCLAAFVLLPSIGMERSLFCLFALYGVIGLLLAVGPGFHHKMPYAGLAAFVLGSCFFPFGTMRSTLLRASASRWMSQGDQVVRIREGVNATYLHIAHRAHGLPWFDQLATNAYSMSVNDFAARRYMKLFAVLPFAIHPHVERALCIGYGIGNTAEALTSSPGLKRLDVVDISPDMLALSQSIPSASGRRVLADPRVHVRIEDGRHVLEAGGPGYDLITGEPPPPIIAGVGSLYSQEYFALVRSRLADGGIATYWLPMMNISADTAKSLIRGFCDAFDDCSLWHASGRNLMLMGTRDAHGPVDVESFSRQFDATRAELAAIGFEHPSQLGALFIGDAAYLNALTRESLPLSDDWPKRIEQPGSREERDALLWELRDTRANRARFAASSFIEKVWPPALLRASEHQFENQRLIDDLLFPGPTGARQIGVLNQVLRSTPLRFPVLLLLSSDPDMQRSLASAAPDAQLSDVWLPHRLAQLLADRNFVAAHELLTAHPRTKLPLPGLAEYVARTANH